MPVMTLGQPRVAHAHTCTEIPFKGSVVNGRHAWYRKELMAFFVLGQTLNKTQAELSLCRNSKESFEVKPNNGFVMITH